MNCRSLGTQDVGCKKFTVQLLCCAIHYNKDVYLNFKGKALCSTCVNNPDIVDGKTDNHVIEPELRNSACIIFLPGRSVKPYPPPYVHTYLLNK